MLPDSFISGTTEKENQGSILLIKLGAKILNKTLANNNISLPSRLYPRNGQDSLMSENLIGEDNVQASSVCVCVKISLCTRDPTVQFARLASSHPSTRIGGTRTVGCSKPFNLPACM